MQVIAALSVLLSFAEAGLIVKAPRTVNAALLPSSGLVMFTFTLPPTTNTIAASPTLSTTTMTATTTTTTTTATTIYAGSEAGDPIHGTATAIANAGSPKTTAAPTLDLGGLAASDGKKFVQTTFWACETFPLETHCGWHEPILDASNSGAGAGAGGAGKQQSVVVAAVALVVAAAVAYGL
ncbi:hypothetical protein F5X97DRAFT_98365 [Nemania serpens]|nr:hypothetical protein F5X97DRAFT_98365 [Nemania serpens]